jgi:hypothetical protein
MSDFDNEDTIVSKEDIHEALSELSFQEILKLKEYQVGFPGTMQDCAYKLNKRYYKLSKKQSGGSIYGNKLDD